MPSSLGLQPKAAKTWSAPAVLCAKGAPPPGTAMAEHGAAAKEMFGAFVWCDPIGEGQDFLCFSSHVHKIFYGVLAKFDDINVSKLPVFDMWEVRMHSSKG